MIAKLTGKISEIREDYLVLDVQGVGYKVENFAPFRLGLEGQEVSLEIHTHVREDELRLFGFSSRPERELFEKLLTVSGVGPKVAMALISTFSVNQIVNAVKNGETTNLAIKGIGSKTLAKVGIELKGKLDKWAKGSTETTDANGTIIGEEVLVEDDFTAALLGLGYNTKDIQGIAGKVGYDKPFSEQIKQALQLLRRN